MSHIMDHTDNIKDLREAVSHIGFAEDDISVVQRRYRDEGQDEPLVKARIKLQEVRETLKSHITAMEVVESRR